jgi:hypothetical protein
MIKPTSTTLGLAALVFCILVIPTAQADSYEGPFCFEKPVAGATDDSGHVRDTCRELEFERIITLDNGIEDFIFTSTVTEEPKSGPPQVRIATTSGALVLHPGYDLRDAAIRFEAEDPIYGGLVEGRPIYLNTMASEHVFAASADAYAADSLIDSGVQFVDAYGKATTRPFNVYYKYRGGVYVPITSPVTKVVENWSIVRKANGFMLVKEKTTLYLDDGSMKVTPHHSDSTTASTSAPVEEEGSWWSRFIGFFKNLF